MLPPLVWRELGVALRRRGARGQWLLATSLAGSITVLALSSGFLDRLGNSRALFRGLFALLCATAVIRGLGITADLFSEERRNGTLGLLVLTGLQPVEIFANKLAGAMLIAAYAILGSLPILAISFVIGGVVPIQFVCALVVLANLLLFCVALGLLASVLHREVSGARLAAIATLLLLCCGPQLAASLGRLIYGRGVVGESWLTLSPAYAPLDLWKGFPMGTRDYFWISCGFTLIYSISALVLAATILHRTWRDAPAEVAVKPRWWQWTRSRVQDTSRQEKVRAQLLNTYPFAWLAARDQREVRMAQYYVVSLTGVWLVGSLILGRNGFGVALGLLCSVLLHQGLQWFFARAAAERLAAERQTGGLEILLTTPLEVHDIINGQLEALKVQFGRTLKMAFVVDVLFLSGILLCMRSSFSNYVLIVAVWLIWWLGNSAARRVVVAMAMWVATWTGRPTYAALHALRPAILLMLTLTPTKSPEVLAEKLWREFRLIANAPIPSPGDRRFAGWNPESIFPPGRWGDVTLKVPRRKPLWTKSKRAFTSGRGEERA